MKEGGAAVARRIRPSEGDWFAVPLSGGKYATGLVARKSRRGDTLLGYFFGPVRQRVPTEADVASYSPADAALISRFFNEPLVAGRWPIVASPDEWNRATWPIPEFHTPRSQELTGQSWAMRYSEDDFDQLVGQRPISHEEEARYPRDGIYTDEYVEHLLEEALGLESRRERRRAANPPAPGATHFVLIPAKRFRNFRNLVFDLAFDDIQVVGRRDDFLDIAIFQEGDPAALRSEVKKAEEELAALARSVGGEYDGLEWAVLPA
jgi:hypothetical protein